VIPKECFRAPEPPALGSRDAAAVDGAISLVPASGSHVLLVEDEALIGAMFKQVLGRLGLPVLGPIATLDQAVSAARVADLRGAVLDVNLAGAPIYPVAEALADRGIPFIFVTGYNQSGMDGRFAQIPLLEKPVDPERLAQLLAGWRPNSQTPEEPPSAVAV
jgi:CheY-like chemotaxis protein